MWRTYKQNHKYDKYFSTQSQWSTSVSDMSEFSSQTRKIQENCSRELKYPELPAPGKNLNKWKSK